MVSKWSVGGRYVVLHEKRTAHVHAVSELWQTTVIVHIHFTVTVQYLLDIDTASTICMELSSLSAVVVSCFL